MSLDDTLRAGLAGAPSPLLVLNHGVAARRVRELRLPANAVVRDLTDFVGLTRPKAPGEPDQAAQPPGGTVVLLVRDRVRLRQAVTVLPELPGARRVVCWIEASAHTAPSLVPRPEWPRLNRLVVQYDGGGTAVADFAGPVASRSVLVELARSVTNQQRLAPPSPRVGVATTQAHHWPVADSRTLVVGHPDALANGDALTPDVLLTDQEPSAEPIVNPYTGAPIATVVLPPEPSWAGLAAMTAAQRGSVLAQGSPSLGGLDEQVLNPSGYVRSWQEGMGSLEQAPGSRDLLVLRMPSGSRLIDARRGTTDGDVAIARRLQGVRIAWRGAVGPHAYSRVVAALGMAGVPLVADSVPTWARALLDPRLTDVLSAGVDLDDPLRREEHSLRARRGALLGHSPAGRQPKVSVLLATRRPDMVAFALRQLARQRGVDLEVVVVTHGFELGADDPAIPHGLDVQVLSAPPDMLFGDVLNLAASRASGDALLKMDDDDWYGPDFVADLALAQRYSSADLVGCPAEFNFIEPLWVTVRRTDTTERFSDFVAGGTMLTTRRAFEEVGGFSPVRRSVDAYLLSALRQAGASIYRTQGLGYVLRRTSQGHTWDPGLGYFLGRARVADQWRGFRPSRILDPSPIDLPQRQPGGPA